MDNALTKRYVLIIFVSCALSLHAQEILTGWQMTEYEKINLLLSHTSFAERIALTPSQEAALQSIRETDLLSIPAVSNLIAESRRTDVVEARVDLLTRASQEASNYKLNRIRGVLSTEQWQAVWRAHLRNEDLCILLYDEEVRTWLGIGPEQREQLQAIAQSYEDLLNALERRLGRQKVAGLRPDESRADREEEIRCIESVIKALKRDMGHDIRAVLSEQQRREWESVINE